MRSMVEGLAESEGPSTALRAVPLPIAFSDREECQGDGPLPHEGYNSAITLSIGRNRVRLSSGYSMNFAQAM